MASPYNVTPLEFSLGFLIISHRASKIFASRILCYAKCCISYLLERLIKRGGNVAGERIAGSPGSGGASPYLRRDCPRQPGLIDSEWVLELASTGVLAWTRRGVDAGSTGVGEGVAIGVLSGLGEGDGLAFAVLPFDLA